MSRPSIDQIESSIVHTFWHEFLPSHASSNVVRVSRAESDLSYFIATLLNFFLEEVDGWTDLTADDLLESVFQETGPNTMSARGLMCWGDQDQIAYLSPFVGTFERSMDELALHDYTLLFAPTSPGIGAFTIPFTKNANERQQLIEKGPSTPEEWGLQFRKRKGF